MVRGDGTESGEEDGLWRWRRGLRAAPASGLPWGAGVGDTQSSALARSGRSEEHLLGDRGHRGAHRQPTPRRKQVSATRSHWFQVSAR